MGSDREQLVRIYQAAIAAADPALAMRRSLGNLPAPAVVIALGKAAKGMASAAGTSRRSLIIDGEVGDHPVPGARSAKAAEALQAFLTAIRPDERVLLLLSGGTSSLVAAPVDGISQDDLARLYTLLLSSGLDIHQVNMVRKRWSRWAAGRLAAALRVATEVLALSDVSGDRFDSIASGPCFPDSSTAAEIVALLKREKLWDRIPDSMRRVIPETLKPGDPVFQHVTHRIVANNRSALDAAISSAGAMGYRVDQGDELRGDAAEAGRTIAQRVSRLAPNSCLVLGGETTVRLERHSGLGGRCQELALAAAIELERLGSHGVTILAAGTDGRDGPTDAAGAIIDSSSASRIRAAGLDPLRHLHEHDSYPALNSVGSLLRTGPTGTNVRDVVVAIRMAG